MQIWHFSVKMTKVRFFSVRSGCLIAEKHWQLDLSTFNGALCKLQQSLQFMAALIVSFSS